MYTLQAYFYSDQNRDYLQVPDRVVTATDGTNTVENFNVVPGFIQGTVTVTGGTIQNGYLYGSRQSPYGYAQSTLVAPSGAFLFPANPGSNSVSGSVTVNGVSVTLPTQQIAVTAGQTTTVNFTVTPAQNTGSVTGALQLAGSITPFRVDVSASGPVSRTATLTQAGTFNLTTLADGNYSMYAYGLRHHAALPLSAQRRVHPLAFLDHQRREYGPARRHRGRKRCRRFNRRDGPSHAELREPRHRCTPRGCRPQRRRQGLLRRQSACPLGCLTSRSATGRGGHEATCSSSTRTRRAT